MRLIGRRNFVQGLGLGAGATLLSPLCARLIASAQGQSSLARRIIFYTQNQGWSTEADDRMVTGPGYKPGANSAMFRAAWRSETDWDLPAMFEPLKAYQREMTILYGFKNFMSAAGAPHGSGNCTLTGTRPKNENEEGDPTGISIDRFIGKELKKRHGDLIDSTNMSTIVYGQYPSSTSADGPGRAADAYTTPAKAYAAYFGQATNMTPQQAQATLDADRSVLDGMLEDIQKARTRLAGFERQKLDQMLESCNELGKKLQARNDPRLQGKPPATTTTTRGSLDNEVAKGYLDLTYQLHAFGLTHVSHIALHGYNTESDSRRAILPDVREDDTHNYVYHGDKGRYSSIEDRENDVRRINQWHARQLAYLRDKLAGVPGGNGTIADETLMVWINAGGYMHHRGHFNHPVVMIGKLQGRVRAPLWMDMTEYVAGQLYRLQGKRHISDAFVTLANAMDLPITTFGEATLCKGVVPGVLA